MSTTKINISPVEGTYIRLILAIENMDKEKLVDLGDSYLLKLNKKNKSGNELYFSMLFNSTFAYQIRQVSSDITRQTCNPL